MNMNLGTLIRLLEKECAENDVTFGFGKPAELTSYRGYYDQLAIVFESYNDATVGSFLAELKGAIGKTFVGYKGGDFEMHEGTPLWVVRDHSETSECTLGNVFSSGMTTVIVVSWTEG